MTTQGNPNLCNHRFLTRPASSCTLPSRSRAHTFHFATGTSCHHAAALSRWYVTPKGAAPCALIQTAPSSRRQIASDGSGFRSASSGCQEQCHPLTFSWQGLRDCQQGCLAGPVGWQQRALLTCAPGGGPSSRVTRAAEEEVCRRASTQPRCARFLQGAPPRCPRASPLPEQHRANPATGPRGVEGRSSLEEAFSSACASRSHSDLLGPEEEGGTTRQP